MPVHWTYDGFTEEDDLEQGDIVGPTSDLRAVLAEVHPHFCDEKYLGFMVATQSCDLVRRGGGLTASYINLAVIRPLAQVVCKLISCVTPPVLPGTFLKTSKGSAKRLLTRLFNQNEQALGLFYLHQDADSGIGEHAVAFLRVNVALRNEHYEKLVAARVGRLTAEFRAKLGWLLGNLYSRPATPDWSEKPRGRQMLKTMTETYLQEQFMGLGPCWIEEEVLGAANIRVLDPARLVAEQIEDLKPASPHLRALEEIRTELSRVAPEFAPELREKLLNRLANNGRFVKLFSGPAEDSET